MATSVSILTSNNTQNVADEFIVATDVLDTKADKSATYTVQISNQLLDAKVDDVETVHYATKIDTHTQKVKPMTSSQIS